VGIFSEGEDSRDDHGLGRLVEFRFNPLTPKDTYSGRTAPLTSKRCILYIYSTNKVTEYFKHGIYCPFFYLQNAVCFIILTYLVPVLFTFYIQSVLKLKKKVIPAPKVLRALLALHPPISPLTSSGQRNRASWASQPRKSFTLLPCPGGKTTKSTRTCGALGGGDNVRIT